ncbi:MAG: RnfABCDGE type electron transport complex subunit D [Thermoplasmata archaeon]|nr:RnfABCDGE type electron transport complex subunit D [Thermoplasmata archaeon]
MEAPGTTADDSPAPSPSLRSLRTSLARAFPAARVTWLALVLLGVWGVVVFRGAGATSLLVLPAAAAILDLGFQSLRFERFRFPDGALATGLFLALILTPTVPLLAAGAVTLAAIGVKHVLRVRGRPILNPAASGVVLGAFAFGLAPAWWVGIGPLGELAMVAAGVAVVLRSPKNWRIPATFFLVFAPLSVLLRFTYGTSLAPSVIVLGVLDPSTLFFGLFMVTEPRTAPANVHLHLVYATLVGWGAAFLPAYLPTTGTLVALLLVGFGFGTYRAARRLASSASATTRAHRPESSAPTGRLPWSPAHRAGAGMLVLLVVAAIASAGITPSATPAANIAHPSHYSGGSPPPSSGGGGGGKGGITAASCLKNNSSIPASTAGMLHTALGPSVLLSYDASTGLTVFYDPVNQVTVTETDLYEDYGYAEFNGDDYAVSGCSP